MSDTPADVFDLGAWVGRKQAFSLIASKCSAADAECLRHIRQNKQYRALHVNWEQFCRDYAGVSRSFADKLIQQLEQLGPQYFELAGVVPITTEDYRRIAPAVTEQGLSCDGETIPIEPENAPKLAQAVDRLRQRAAPVKPPGDDAQDAPARAGKKLLAAIAELERLATLDLAPSARRAVQTLATDARDRLVLLLRQM